MLSYCAMKTNNNTIQVVPIYRSSFANYAFIHYVKPEYELHNSYYIDNMVFRNYGVIIVNLHCLCCYKQLRYNLCSDGCLLIDGEQRERELRLLQG